jgi:hypothetical protein
MVDFRKPEISTRHAAQEVCWGWPSVGGDSVNVMISVANTTWSNSSSHGPCF